MTPLRTLSLALSLAAAVAAVWTLATRPSAPQRAALGSREQAMELLGNRIAQLKPQGHVLVLANPFSLQAGSRSDMVRFDEAGLNGLRRGLGKRSTMKVVHPDLRPEYLANPDSILIPPDSTNPLSFLIHPPSVEALAQANPDCNVVVSLIGLPVGVDQLPIWNARDPRCFALLMPDLRLLGPPEKSADAFRRGKILVAVADRADANGPLVITADNIDDILQRHPKALGY